MFETSFDLDPVLVPEVLLALLGVSVLAAAGVTLFGSRNLAPGRRILALSLRLAVLAALAVVLLRPGIVVTQTTETLPLLYVLVDTSRSMSVEDVSGGQTRHAAVVEVLGRLARPLAKLRRGAEVRVFAVDGALRPAHPDQLPPADGEASAQGEALLSLSRDSGGRPLAGVLFFTDGVVTRGAPLREGAGRLVELGAPLYAVMLGDPRPREAPDLILAELNAPVRATVGERTEVEAVVNVAGFPPGARLPRVTVEFAVDGERRETTFVSPSVAGTARVKFDFLPRQPGVFRLGASASGLENELRLANNTRQALVVVEDAPLRVLLVQGTLSPAYKFVRRGLAEDGLRLTVVRDFLRPPPGKPWPAAGIAPELETHHVVFLADVDPAHLVGAAVRQLMRRIAEGGAGLVWQLSGPSSRIEDQALEALLPVTLLVGPDAGRSERGTPPALTETGARHPVCRVVEDLAGVRAAFAALPAPLEVVLVGGVKAGAELLVTAGSRPLIVAAERGKGRVLLILSPDLSRWARAEKGPEIHDAFWRQAVSWAGGRELSDPRPLLLLLEHHRLGAGEELPLRVRLAPPFREALVQLRLRGPLGSDKTPPLEEKQLVLSGSDQLRFGAVVPGRAGEYEVIAVGLWQEKKIGEDSARLLVEGLPPELEHTRPDQTALRAAAELTGGKLLALEETAAGLAELAARCRPQKTIKVSRRELWLTPLLLTALCLSLFAEWWLRTK